MHHTKRRVRLPLAPDVTAPRFTCPKQACDISTIGCGNRHHQARATTNAHTREMLASCISCPVGEANLAGEPMPSLDLLFKPKEEIRMSSTAAAAAEGGAKKWSERVCARDKETRFQPTSGLQKACGICLKCKAADGTKRKQKPNKVAAKTVRANGSASPVEYKIVASALPVPLVDGIAGATALLEKLGLHVMSVSTPKGIVLLVSAAA